jgi:ABC-type transport system substrate-binding protein
MELAGDSLAYEMGVLGIPVNETLVTYNIARTVVMQQRNYNLYTGAWVDFDTSWIEPDSQFSALAYLDAYSSDGIYPTGPNYPQFRNATYDQLCQEVDSPANLTLAKSAALSCQEILVQEAACVWLCSPYEVTSYSNLRGVTSIVGGGIDNQWTFLKAEPSLNSSVSTIYYGILTPSSLNVVTDYGSSDCLDRIYDTLISYCPYDRTPGNVFADGDRGGTMPWLAKDWDVGTWESPYSPGTNLTMLTFYLRDGVMWHDGVPLNSTDVKFTIDYLKGLGDISWLYPYVSDVYQVLTPDANTVVVYENVSNVRTLDDIGKLPILPEHIFKNIGQNVTGYTPGADAGFPANETLIGCGPWKYVSDNSSMLCLTANRDYFMETPPEAEVDFRYDWKLGCWAVDAMDATMVGEALYSSGVGTPSTNWQPGCDLNGDGTVDSSDLNIVSTEFNETWGESATRSFAESPNCAVYVDLVESSLSVGQNLTVYVMLRNLNNLTGFQFKLNYDETMLNCLNLSLPPVFSGSTQPIESVVNQTAGLIWVSNISLPSIDMGIQPVSGNVTLATITFNTTQAGSSMLHLWDTELASQGPHPDPQWNTQTSPCQPMLHQEIDASVTVCVPTPAGTNITVAPAQKVSVTFANVTSSGFTTLNTTQPPTAQFASVVCDKLTTNATFSGNVTLQFPYDPDGLSPQEQKAEKIWLWNDSSSSWVDVTTGVNTTSHVVYGLSPHLSVFGITSCFGITGDTDVVGSTTVSVPAFLPPAPNGLSFVSSYNVSTTKSLEPPFTMNLAYNWQNVQPDEEMFTKLWLWNTTSNSWVDITTGVDTANHIVHGLSPHLSVFGVTTLSQAPIGINVVSAYCPAVLPQGACASIDFTVCNMGASTQADFDVTLCSNTTVIATFHVDQLGPTDQATFSTFWDTVGLAVGNYSISVSSYRIGWSDLSANGNVGSGRPPLLISFQKGKTTPKTHST